MKAKVFQSKENLTQDEKNQIARNLFDNNRAKPGQLIDYQYFLQLYELYKDTIGEKQFANVLEINDENYYSIKNKRTENRNIKKLQNRINR